MPIETRTTSASEIRAVRDADGKPKKLTGYAARFDSPSVPLPVKEDEPNGRKFVERIAPGAFRNAVGDGASDDPVALCNHDPNMVLGRCSSGTLRVAEDEHGLTWEADLPDTQYARDVAAAVDRGDIKGCSFGFATVRDEWSMADGMPQRRLLEVRLRDVGPATFPAYADTSVDVRSVETAIGNLQTPPGERRATVLLPAQECKTDSVLYCAGAALRQFREAFDTCQMVIANLAPREGVTVTLEDADAQALSDAMDQAEDLAEKLDQFRAACEAAGVNGGGGEPVGAAASPSDVMRMMVDLQRRGLDVPRTISLAPPPERRAGHMTHASGPSLNKTAEDAAAAMIRNGKTDDGEWSFTADDEDALLKDGNGKENWTAYGKNFLSIDRNADEKTKAAYKYPYGKGGKVYRRALIAIKGRATQQDLSAVNEAAGRLLGLMDPGEA